MSDTPRTDERLPKGNHFATLVVTADFARELERELQEAINSRDIWKKLCFEQRDTMAELRKDKARLDWMLKASDDGLMRLDGWDRDCIDSAIDAEETQDLKAEKLQADAREDAE
jgi:hypothetical protein